VCEVLRGFPLLSQIYIQLFCSAVLAPVLQKILRRSGPLSAESTIVLNKDLEREGSI